MCPNRHFGHARRAAPAGAFWDIVGSVGTLRIRRAFLLMRRASRRLPPREMSKKMSLWTTRKARKA